MGKYTIFSPICGEFILLLIDNDDNGDVVALENPMTRLMLP